MSDLALGTRLINRVLVLQKSRLSVEYLRKISSTHHKGKESKSLQKMKGE